MQNRVVIVTGGGRGIGRAVCERFARDGARVVAAARSVAELDQTREAIESAGGECRVQAANVCEPDDIDLLVKRTIEWFGRIDVLVNNAGAAPLSSLEELDPTLFDALISVNVRAVYYACRCVWPVMREQGGGVIINLSSVAAVDPFPGFAAYGASKAWVSAWTAALAKEGHDAGIGVFAVAPGAVNTRMLHDAFPSFPADQMLEPADVAEVIYAMAQPAARYTSGQTVFVRK